MKILLLLLVLSSYDGFSQTLLASNPHPKELELLQLINEVRTNPKKFLADRALPYILETEEDTVENRYVASLLTQLRNPHPVAALKQDIYLHDQAHSFAADMGKTGAVGHFSKKLGSFEQRLKKYANKAIGENCDYGSDEPLDILMNLLIDDGVVGVGHRKNLLSSRFKWIGIAIEPHKTYEWNCVIDFCD
jgi:uncharacterized protein YkwD